MLQRSDIRGDSRSRILPRVAWCAGGRKLTFNLLEDRSLLTAAGLDLAMTASTLAEGQSIVANVTLAAPAEAAVAVAIGQSLDGQLNIPTITIPAGQSSASISISAVDDDVPTLHKLRLQQAIRPVQFYH